MYRFLTVFFSTVYQSAASWHPSLLRIEGNKRRIQSPSANIVMRSRACECPTTADRELELRKDPDIL